MTDASVAPQYSWTCADCGRKVPNRFDMCRCGATRDSGGNGETGAMGAIGTIGAEPSPPHASILPWLVLGFVALAAAGTLIAIQVIPLRPQPSADIVSDATPSAPV